VVEPGEMRGLPMARTTSADGRRAYTLYNGGGRKSDEAFIHMLDTVDGISHCIDLTNISGVEAWELKLQLAPGGGALDVMRGDRTLARMDTKTYAVTEPRTQDRATSAGPSGGGGITAVAIGAVVGVALLAGTALAVRRRRGGSLPADPFGPGEPDVSMTEQPGGDHAQRIGRSAAGQRSTSSESSRLTR
jgi:hypothetical protein